MPFAEYSSGWSFHSGLNAVARKMAIKLFIWPARDGSCPWDAAGHEMAATTATARRVKDLEKLRDIVALASCFAMD